MCGPPNGSRAHLEGARMPPPLHLTVEVEPPRVCRRLQRPHSSLRYLTPYAAVLTTTCDRLRNRGQVRRSHVAYPAPNGVSRNSNRHRMKLQRQVIFTLNFPNTSIFFPIFSAFATLDQGLPNNL
jgi:hypothetical protein